MYRFHPLALKTCQAMPDPRSTAWQTEPVNSPLADLADLLKTYALIQRGPLVQDPAAVLDLTDIKNRQCLMVSLLQDTGKDEVYLRK